MLKGVVPTAAVSHLNKAFSRGGTGRARTWGWPLAGLASFCLSGAVVLGFVEGPSRPRIELTVEEARAFTLAFPVPSESAEIAPFAEPVVASAAPAASPLPQSDELETEQGPAEKLASEVTLPDPAHVGESSAALLPPLLDSLDARHAFVAAAPLPPSRPRGLSHHGRLASTRQPIEFRLADRGSSL